MSVFWILTTVPIIVFHISFIVGILALVVSLFIGIVPFLTHYKLPIQLIALILIVSATFFEGALAYKQSIAVEVAELKLKLKEKELESTKTNVKIVEKVVTDTKVIREKGKTITEYIDREVVKYNDECRIPSKVIDIHNDAIMLKLKEKETPK